MDGLKSVSSPVGRRGRCLAYLVAGAAAFAADPFVAAFLFFLTCFLAVVAFVPELGAGVVA